jgi:hypothetical protein
MSSTDEQIKDLINESHARSRLKILHYVKNRLPAASKEQIFAVFDSLKPKDKYKMSSGEHSKHYYVPIFTPFRGGYQIDIIEQSRGGTDVPKYFFVAINVNTRFGFAKAMKRKSADEMIEVLNAFSENMKDNPIHQITADEDSAWNNNKVEEWLKEHKIKSRYIRSDRHSALGTIDRFIRTLRDMNTRDDDGKVSDKRDFTDDDIQKYIQLYNSTFHSSIQMSPEEMQKNPDAEKKYIIEKVYEMNRREKITDYNLKVGSWVRYMIPRKMIGKRRFQVSPGVVQIVRKEGHAYICMAKDGSTVTIARWRLFPVQKEGYEIEATLGEATGIVKRIVSKKKRGRKTLYEVEWETPEGVDPVTTWEEAKNIKKQTGVDKMIEEFNSRERSSS